LDGSLPHGRKEGPQRSNAEGFVFALVMWAGLLSTIRQLASYAKKRYIPYTLGVGFTCDKSQLAAFSLFHRSHKLFTWWDMHKFMAEAIGETLLLIGKMSASSHVMIELGQGQRVNVDAEGRKTMLENTIPKIQDVLRQTGLTVSLAYTERIRRRFSMEPAVTSDEVKNLMVQLEERIQDELKSELIMHVPKESAGFYEQSQLFGSEVYKNFPSAAFDIEESGKCLALGRATACVMHLSRAAEVTLKVLANALALPPRNDWGRHIEDISKELEKRYKTAGKRTLDELFYSEAVAQIEHIKNAWRNPTMHVDRIYTEQVAEDSFLAIGAFMRHLATRLHE
jgi:hypothetical protein